MQGGVLAYNGSWAVKLEGRLFAILLGT